MLSAKKIYDQINKLTIELIESGLCDAQNFPAMKNYSGNVIEISVKSEESSIFLKSIPYSDMFNNLNQKNSFNIKMLDGALLTFQYRFVNDKIVAHRLSYLPAPDLDAFQSQPELYLEDVIYADVVDKRVVSVPIRFDYDSDESVFEPVQHPISHLTLGQYKNCRIPVSGALTPFQFILFVINNFYHTAFEKYSENFTVFKDCFEESIFDEERELIHLNTPKYKMI